MATVSTLFIKDTLTVATVLSTLSSVDQSPLSQLDLLSLALLVTGSDERAVAGVGTFVSRPRFFNDEETHPEESSHVSPLQHVSPSQRSHGPVWKAGHTHGLLPAANLDLRGL